MNAPLYNALIQYSKTKYPFHMPGHKLGSFGDLKDLDLFAMDVTEANGLDNLYEAEGIIADAMTELSRFYGSKETMMLTNGSTAGIIASILAICNPGDKILVARNCHYSVWHALVLCGAIPIYITPEYDEETGLLTTITPKTIESYVLKYPEVKAALIVSPTYEGIVSDIEAISRCLHAYNKILIVDEAHGAHFVVNDYFPSSSIARGADIVVQSMHKTLPTLTQSALLHLGSNRVQMETIIKNLKMVQTSSPSYMMMGLMDYTRAYIEENRKMIQDRYIHPLAKCRKLLRDLKHLKLLDKNYMIDKGKIIILTQDSSIDGYTLAYKLEELYQFVVEAALPNYIIIMTTVADTEEKLMALANALLDIDRHIQSTEVSCREDYRDSFYNTIKGLDKNLSKSPRETYYGQTLMVEYKMCKGYISKENIMLYPPGIPIICMGEIITEKHIDFIEKWGHQLKGILHQEGKMICKVTRVGLQ